MATPVIKLEPVRMGSITNSTQAQKYLPPNMRGSDTGPVKVDLGVDNFPTLGSAPKRVVWGNHVVKSLAKPLATPKPLAMAAPKPTPVPNPEPKPDIPNMMEKIKEHIRQAELEEEERQKPKEENPYKMTREELLQDGWAVLSLSKNAVNESMWRINTPITSALTSEDYYE